MTPEEEARTKAYLDSRDTYVQNEDEDDVELRVSFVVPGSPRIARLIANAAQIDAYYELRDAMIANKEELYVKTYSVPTR